MKIKYCTDDFLEEYKTNFDSYIDLYLNNEKNKIYKLFNHPKNVKESTIEFQYSDLKSLKNSKNPKRDNIKLIYESFISLDRTQAIDERLWVAMYNLYYWEDIMEYININKDRKTFKNGFKSSMVFTQGNKRSLIVQNLSSLWWLGYYLYDDSNIDNPYELLDFYTDTKDIVGKSTVFFSSNLTNNKNLTFGIIEGIKYLADLDVIENKRYYYVEVNKYFNIVGGVRLLDFMSRNEVKKETIEYIENKLI